MTTENKRTLMWRDALLMALRTRDVPGPAIGDVLAQVDAHCAESGQDPWEAFGDPFEYADTVLGAPPAKSPSAAWRKAYPFGAVLLGILCALAGAAAIGAGEAARVTAGQLLALGLLFGVIAAVDRFLAVLVRRTPLLLLALLLVGVVGYGALPLAFPQVALRVPGWLMVAAGAPLFAFGWHGAVLSRDATGDRVVDPRTGADMLPPMPGMTLAFVRWSIPVLLVCAAVAFAVIPHRAH